MEGDKTAAPEETSPETVPADADSARAARAVMRACDRAALATAARDAHGWPFASLVLVAFDHDVTPLLLISALADHTRNALADPRVSLLFDGTSGLSDPLTGPRVSVLGRMEPSADPRHRDRFLARHPGAARYADFRDFSLYRIAVERAHLVAGFGRVHRIDGARLVLPPPVPPLAWEERGLVGRLNQDHSDAVDLLANRIPGCDGRGWIVSGIDPEGVDLRLGDRVARLPFSRNAREGRVAKEIVTELVEDARRQLRQGAAIREN